MRVALFGGSFDPIHNGHIALIEGALNYVDRVVVIPSARNSFKRGRVSSPAPYRLFMTCDVLKTYEPRVVVSDIEFTYEGISYTYKTIEKLLEGDYLNSLLNTNEKIDLFWICGSDILSTFDDWMFPLRILENASLMVAKRPGESSDYDVLIKRIEEKYSTEVYSIHICGKEVSSSSLRSDMDLSMIPSGAIEFIRRNSLYCDDILDECNDDTVEFFYECCIDLYGILSRDRLVHSINVALLAVRLAYKNSEDCNKAIIAGILHDCAKELDLDTLISYSSYITNNEFDIPALLHAPAGAYFAQQKWGIDDQYILDSIIYHSTGREHMTTLDKIIYLSDKIEPARDFDDLKEIRPITNRNLDQGLELAIKSYVRKLKRKGRDVHPFTLACLRELSDNNL